MAVVVSMLRGVNLGAHHRVKMDALRKLYESLKLSDPQTYVQSGNVVFRTDEQDLAKVARRIEAGIEQTFGFRSDTILRTTVEMRNAVAANPFAGRPGIEPAKLLVTFLAGDPGQDARDLVMKIDTNPEELHIRGREVYIYFPDGAGRSKLPWAKIDKLLGTSGTARNWNSVTKLLEMAESLEAD